MPIGSLRLAVMVDLPSLEEKWYRRIDTMAILNRKKQVAVCNRKCHGCFQIALTLGKREGFKLTS